MNGYVDTLAAPVPPASSTIAEQNLEDSTRAEPLLSREHIKKLDEMPTPASLDLAAQLQVMLGTVWQLYSTALKQGSAVAVSPVGAMLQDAVGGLGDLLSNADKRDLAHIPTQRAAETQKLVDAVQSGMLASLASAEQVLRALPAHQAKEAEMQIMQFQSAIMAALRRVRNVMSSAGA